MRNNVIDWGKKIIIITIWLMIWQIVSELTGLELIMASPVSVFKALIGMLGTKVLYITVLKSFINITAGFLIAFILGTILGVIAARFSVLEDFLGPLVQLMKTLPMTSFIILLLIWFGADYVALYISFIVVFPTIYISVITGIRKASVPLLEMAQVFQVPVDKQIRGIYLPSIYAYVENALKTVMGMCWKAGVSAEVIGLVRNSVGEQLYYSKLYFMTADLFAWSIIVVAVSLVFEIVFIRLLRVLVSVARKMDSKMDYIKKKKSKVYEFKEDSPDILLMNVCKSFGDNILFENMLCSLTGDKIHCIMGESGSGKTTLLRLMMGLEEPDDYDCTMKGLKRASAVFQEDRLIEDISAIENIRFAVKGMSVQKAREELEKLLPSDSLDKEVSKLSGGMKRRVAIVRAMLSPSMIVYMDEPFNGLDNDNKAKVQQYIKDNRNGRTIILVTHNNEDAEAMTDKISLLTSK